MKKNRIIYLAVFLAAGIFVYNFPNRYFATMFYLVLFIPVFSFSMIVYVIARFKLSHAISTGRIVKGDTVVYTCSIHNEDIIPYPEMRVAFEGEHLIFHDQVESPSFVLGPRSSYDIDITLHCMYRGLYNVGVKYIEITDFFNMFKLRFKSFQHKKILVYPKVLYFKNLYVNRIGNLENGIKDKRRFLQNQSLSEIKDYEYGERLSLVHWKMTARLGRLMSKKMESITDEKYTIYMDLQRADLGHEENIVIEDKLIELFVAFGNVIISNGIPFDLKYMLPDGLRSEKYSDISQFEFFYERAANMQFSKAENIVSILKNNGPELSQTALEQGKIFVFTFNLTPALAEILEFRSSQGFRVFLFAVSARELSDEDSPAETYENALIGEIAHVGIKVYRLDIADNLTGLLEGEVI